jgi:hypothetical protein
MTARPRLRQALLQHLVMTGDPAVRALAFELGLKAAGDPGRREFFWGGRPEGAALTGRLRAGFGGCRRLEPWTLTSFRRHLVYAINDSPSKYAKRRLNDVSVYA